VTSEDIAQSVTVHPVRLRKILSLLSFKRGSKRRLFLKEKPENITLDKIFMITSEDTLIPKCPEANENCIVGKNLSSILLNIFEDAEEHLMNYLKGITILDIIKQINDR
jgi:DNA-binding IscR family transcriptional regulator